MSSLKKAWRMEVEWVDSTHAAAGWVDIATALDRADNECITVGIVLADDKQGVVLAASVHHHEAAGIMRIPKGAIIRKRRLR